MGIQLFDHQRNALEKIKTGSILRGGVGSGKTLTSLAYYVVKECGGSLQINGESNWAPLKNPKPLYVITTAQKRDSKDWEHEASELLIPEINVDSWNNISKYTTIQDAFFIFDEQRLLGSGTWVKAFLKIVKNNNWILLTATPGDRWTDYIPVFIANGFYKNKTEFVTRHIVYKRFSKFPKIERYLDIQRLINFRDRIVIPMRHKKITTSQHIPIYCDFNKSLFDETRLKRFDPYIKEPIRDIAALCLVMRKIVNSDPDRLVRLYQIYNQHKKVIVFYNFNYELDILEDFCLNEGIPYTQWNGHYHQKIPQTDTWIYLVQYAAGAEAWNCIETDCIVFYSQNYSYRTMTQAAGRIDRLNTPFVNLYYYHFVSYSFIDICIKKALDAKENFNEYIHAKL